uniref:Fragment n=1 Tax=Solanum tuberosum TaxID=4113 RepID=M1B1B6_SOLTU
MPPPLPETDSPAPKKHKLGDHANISDEEDGYTNPIFRTCTVYDSEEENYCPDIPGAKMDKPLWEKYWKQIKESEGTSYEVENILKVNGEAVGRYFAYYLTFSTKNGEKNDTFQAKVLEDLDDSIQCLIVRPKVATMG